MLRRISDGSIRRSIHSSRSEVEVAKKLHEKEAHKKRKLVTFIQLVIKPILVNRDVPPSVLNYHSSPVMYSFVLPTRKSELTTCWARSLPFSLRS